MGNFPLLGYASRAVYYPTTLSTDWVTVTGAISSANTWGDWCEAIDETPFDCVLHWIRRNNCASTNAMAFKMAIGASSSEVEIMEEVLLGGYIRYADSTLLPLYIPKGSRISIKAQQQLSSASPYSFHSIGCLDVSGFKRPLFGGKIDSYGFQSASTTGTTVDPGGTSRTKGSWTEITSATTEEYKGLFYSTSGLSVSSNIYWNFDIGFGGSGSEQVVIGDLPMSRSSASYVTSPYVGHVMPISVPEGTRIAVRCASSSTTVGWREIDICIHGVR